MGFLIHDTKDGQPGPWEYLEASAIGACKVGMALTLTEGKLAKATATVKPTYISMYQGTVASGDKIPVLRVLPDTRFKTQLSAAGTALKVGDKVTIDTTGMLATATTTSGILEIVQINGTGIGDDVIVRIP